MKNRKTFSLVGALAVVIPVLAAVLFSQQDVIMTIKEGVPAISFALPKFSAPESVRAAADEIYQVLSADLKYSRVFDLLPQNYYDYIGKLDSQKINFKDWESIQAKVLCVGSASEGTGGDINFEWKLFEVKSGQLIKGKRFSPALKKAQLRDAAHQVANDLMAVHGEKPVFTSKIAFVSDRDGNREIYMMDYDGANQTRLTFTVSKKDNISPAWAPNRNLIAYTSYLGDIAGLYILKVYEQKRIPVSLKGGNFSPAWSPDGKKLAFSSTRDQDGNSEIYVADIDDDSLNRGSFGIKRLTFNPGIDTAPSWSPTGRQIAFVSDRGGTAQIYTMDAEGSNIQRVSFGGASHNDSPAWSPAGDRIVYVARVDNVFDLYLLNLRTQQISKLTEDNARNESPAWSPDGRHIVFTSNIKGGLHLYSIDYDGANRRQLTTKGQNNWPDWSN